MSVAEGDSKDDALDVYCLGVRERDRIYGDRHRNHKSS